MWAKLTSEYHRQIAAAAQAIVLSACAHHAVVKTVTPATESPVVLTVKSEALACGALADQIGSMLGPSNQVQARAAASLPNSLEPAVLSAMAVCEQVLLKTKGLEMGNGSLLEALTRAQADPEEVSGYAALLTRYAQQGGMRRWLYYGPKLARLFQFTYDHRTQSQRCSRTAREFSYFLETAPPPLGGDLRRGAALHKSECEVVSEQDRRLPELDRRHANLLAPHHTRDRGHG